MNIAIDVLRNKLFELEFQESELPIQKLRDIILKPNDYVAGWSIKGVFVCCGSSCFHGEVGSMVEYHVL